MPHYAFLSVLLAASFIDILFHQGTSFAPWAMLYVGLKMQADRAAYKFLRDGLVFPKKELAGAKESSWLPPDDQDPFAHKQNLHIVGAPRAEKSRAETKPKEEARPKNEAPRPSTANNTPNSNTSSRPKPRANLYRAPIFHGKPHEVLGIELNANTQRILKAFRHWIKEFHPDHAKSGQEAQCTKRALSLNEAKSNLLDRRKQMRKSA